MLFRREFPDSEQAQRTEAAAQALRLKLMSFPIGGPDQLASAFEMMSEVRSNAVLFRGTPWFLDANQVAALILKHRRPTIHNLREFALAGALMSYAS